MKHKKHTPDNFTLVYDGDAWHGPKPPSRILALILMALMVGRRR